MTDKVFDLTKDAETEDPGLPKSFTIKYMRLKDDKWEQDEDKFMARPRVSAGLVARTIGAFAGTGYESAAAVQDFLDRAIVDDDRLRFLSLIEDADVQMELRDMTAITDWLIGEYSNPNRPTKSA